MHQDALYIRLRALCCSEWGMTPGAFERACEDGEVALEDVAELFLYKAAEPLLGGRMFPWLFREAERSKRAELARAQHLMMMYQAAQDDETRERIGRELAAINERR